MELKCKIQTYDWGRYGIDSTVATLVKSANSDFTLDEKKPYAELWMGIHPNGPSYVKELDMSLEKYIKKNNNVLGTDVQKIFGEHLPFLFKVLSVNKALSIQAHPNKEKAKELHQQYPTIYKDANHKPELAIALTPFEALCGFRPISEIKEFLKVLPELRTVIGEDKVYKFMATDEASVSRALKTCFHSLMTCDSGLVALQLRKLLDRLSNLDESLRQFLLASSLERLYSNYPGDVGCFGIYIFNFITMQPGEAIYIGPNEPHAYLSGDCVECMACSDNVVRAGLTPKLKDVPTLIEMLTYNCEPVSAKKFQPSREDECTEVFRPPVLDFAVAKITIPPGRSYYDIIPRSTASILIIINGKGEISSSKILYRGSVIFIPANEKIGIKVLCGCHPMLMFQAFVNI
ncbi:mannose phosphate isomerase [Nomia melanderi]|uniref:mannose phosphate isomerase n=1 Tax=Nomia melanderi TaxID=2448451 RepID=UPI0013042B29|nr:mannose-6-phosphate isomerase [Nomia melanderi]XP_031830409.1 mannose-6-phosphate isomerase [Nomia melanderi]XP_031830410.1 mannose-6-phosphate isomerase [Nomia melanderi]XP_031830411.1 mannose-6-phosphate isomerase [Nomia melanderi]XP_031830412.1 mannose-6-phosphate isomerase [Nomia melanderi]XP_031830413.1 mannose-6-phosphate isomerase [Nomia melanderi]XP_031830414.1 mannose-6-phosphate isomerase [Nomia melanderi]XP_031830415.1 mannose-6-phosphate isomerase [Nomia melanderi]